MIKNVQSFHEQATLEIRLLHKLRGGYGVHNIVCMKSYFIFRQHVCIVFELLGANLYQCISTKLGLAAPHVKMIASQVLLALKYIEKHEIIHCDLKPENILMEESGKVRVIDFGSACELKNRTHSYI